jgi:hypothetical protein
VAQEELGVLVGAACRQQPEECEHAGEGEIGESQHDRASWCVGCWLPSRPGTRRSAPMDVVFGTYTADE